MYRLVVLFIYAYHVVVFLAEGKTGAVKCYVCTTHFNISGPSDELSSFVLEHYNETRHTDAQCVNRPLDSEIKQCVEGCLTVGGRGQLVQPQPKSTGTLDEDRSFSPYHSGGVYGVGRRCVRDLDKLSEGLTVPDTESCEHQHGNILGLNAHLVVCRCNTDLCNTRTDIFEQLRESSCIVRHIRHTNEQPELRERIFNETTVSDRQSCVIECANTKACNSVNIKQLTNQGKVKCIMSSREADCGGDYPTEFSDDVESDNIGSFWLSCLSEGCKDHKAKTSLKIIPLPNDCRLRNVDVFPSYCHQMRHEMKNRKFCSFVGFRRSCARTCCDVERHGL